MGKRHHETCAICRCCPCHLIDDVARAFDDANGDHATRTIIFTGAGRAFCAGDDRLMDEARSIAGQLSQLPPLSVRAMKRTLNHCATSDLTRALELETEATIAGFLDPETTERLKEF
jgi:enoyl-CoA hydratase/carnithine racemase